MHNEKKHQLMNQRLCVSVLFAFLCSFFIQSAHGYLDLECHDCHEQPLQLLISDHECVVCAQSLASDVNDGFLNEIGLVDYQSIIPVSVTPCLHDTLALAPQIRAPPPAYII